MVKKGIWQTAGILGRWRKFLPIINLCLMGVVLFLSGLSAYSYFGPAKYHVEARSHRTPNEEKPFAEIVFQHEDPMHFREVSLQNIFSPERQEWDARKEEEGKVEKKEKKPLMAPLIAKLTVYGLARIGGEKNALVNDLEDENKDRQYRYVSEGDMLLGCTVKRIEKEGMTLDCQGQEIVKTIQNRKDDHGEFIRAASDTSTQTKKPGPHKLEPKAGAAPGMERDAEPGRPKGPGNAMGKGEEGEKEGGMNTIKGLLELLKSMEKK